MLNLVYQKEDDYWYYWDRFLLLEKGPYMLEVLAEEALENYFVENGVE